MILILILATFCMTVYGEDAQAPAADLVSWDEFNNAVKAGGYAGPSRDQYNNFIHRTSTSFSSYPKQELAMFLAQCMWESGGLKYKKELACVKTQCKDQYRTGKEAPGKYYYGRGYLQLSWLYNYQACSKDLYNDQRLVTNPDMVSDNEDVAWASALWFWSKNVHTVEAVRQGHFGASTMAINGALECKGAHQDIAKKRYAIYVKVLKAFDLSKVVPNEHGCYN